MAEGVAESVEWGSDPEGGESIPTSEEKYKSQMRQIVTQKIDLPISALVSMLEDQIQLNPDFQRRERWSAEMQSRLIESLVMNVPIPPVFMGEDEYGKYVVLDGRQRLTAIKAFLENVLKLKGLEVWSELNGKTYNDLVKRQEDKYFTRRFVPAVIILKESSPQVKYDVFDRLNTGGVRANAMEIRNAVHRGRFTDLLHEVSRYPDFCKLWGIPLDGVDAESNEIFRKMQDLEIVLRFFALREYPKMDTVFKDYLSDFMVERNRAYQTDKDLPTLDRAAFQRASTNCWKVFGNDAFKRPSGFKSAPLSDAIMIGLSDVVPENLTEEVCGRVRAAINELFQNDVFLKSIGTGTNGRGAIETRICLAREAVERTLKG